MGKRVFALLLIVAVSIVFVKEPAVAAPIFQLSLDNISHGGPGYSLQGSDSSSFSNKSARESFSLPFPLAQGRDSSIVTSEMVLDEMWSLPSNEIAAMREDGERLVNFLIPIFFGSSLIGLSGFIKIFNKNQTSMQHAQTPMKTRASYENTLSIET